MLSKASRADNNADRYRLERLDQAALLSARFQLEPTEINRDRLRTFLSLMGQPPLDDGDGV
jgi:hypothetical protein